jgi:ABC-type antimicrobial peptide transport system permease subunit
VDSSGDAIWTRLRRYAARAVIALIGGVAGTLQAWWTFQALLPSVLSTVPRMSQPRLDASPNLTALWFGLAITVATAVLCGIVPALRPPGRSYTSP